MNKSLHSVFNFRLHFLCVWGGISLSLECKASIPPANNATLACRGSYGHRAIPLKGSPTISRESRCNKSKVVKFKPNSKVVNCENSKLWRYIYEY